MQLRNQFAILMALYLLSRLVSFESWDFHILDSPTRLENSFWWSERMGVYSVWGWKWEFVFMNSCWKDQLGNLDHVASVLSMGWVSVAFLLPVFPSNLSILWARMQRSCLWRTFVNFAHWIQQDFWKLLGPCGNSAIISSVSIRTSAICWNTIVFIAASVKPTTWWFSIIWKRGLGATFLRNCG